jgi:hypothetical protein
MEKPSKFVLCCPLSPRNEGMPAATDIPAPENKLIFTSCNGRQFTNNDCNPRCLQKNVDCHIAVFCHINFW